LTAQSAVLLNTSEVIQMKIAKDPVMEKKVKKTKKKSGVYEDVDAQLFEKLRELRMQIAKKEKVPPYLVFSDKTLNH
ncbi:MAG: HRDC domain-containing protein, partial [Lachnospiraceae bacterium]